MTTDTGASVGVVAVAVAVAKGTGVKAVVVTGVLSQVVLEQALSRAVQVPWR